MTLFLVLACGLIFTSSFAYSQEEEEPIQMKPAEFLEAKPAEFSKMRTVQPIPIMPDMKYTSWQNLKTQVKTRSLYFNTTPKMRNKSKSLNFVLGEIDKIFVELKRANTWANCLLPEGWEVKPNKNGDCGFFESCLGIFWDGRATVCCQDFNGSINVGDATTSTIANILEGEIRTNMNVMEKKGRLINPYCQICRGSIIENDQKIANIKNHGLFNKGFNITHRAKARLFK